MSVTLVAPEVEVCGLAAAEGADVAVIAFVIADELDSEAEDKCKRALCTPRP